MKPFKENLDRSALIVGEITQESLSDVLPIILQLDKTLHRDGIIIYMTSPGGQATAGMALYDCLKMRRNNITIVAQGECSSIAALVMQAADRRLISPHSRLLLHYGHVDMGHKGSVDADTLIRSGKEVERLDRTFVEILWGGCKSGIPREQVADLLRGNTFLNSYEALDWGFVDAITYTPNYRRKP